MGKLSTRHFMTIPNDAGAMRIPGADAESTGSAQPLGRSLTLPESADRVIDAVQSVSRRIEDLARELNCLGFFDDDDRPRAA